MSISLVSFKRAKFKLIRWRIRFFFIKENNIIASDNGLIIFPEKSFLC